MSLTFKQRIIGAVLLAALVPMAVVSGIFIYEGFDTARKMGEDGLHAVGAATAADVTGYFDILEGQVRERALDPATVQSLKEFEVAEDAFDPAAVQYDTAKLRERYVSLQQATSNTTPDQVDGWMPTDKKALALQYLYMANNPNPIGEKQKLDNAGDGSEYSRVHARYHYLNRQYVSEFNLYDYFLADQKGRIIYSVFKETDFQSSVKEGPLANSELSKVLRQALASHKPEEVFFSDIAPYLPSRGEPAMFMAAPLIENGQTIGAVAIQVPLDRINSIFKPLKIVGDTVDGFIAGPDLKFKTPQTAENGKAGEDLPDSLKNVVKPLFDGTAKDGTYRYLGEDGGPMTGTFLKLDMHGDDWVMVVGQDDAELFDDIYHEIYMMLGILVGVLMVSVLFGFYLGGSLVKPVQALARGFFAGAEKVGRSTSQVGEAVSSMVAASEETSAQSKVVRKNSGEASGYVSSVSTAVEELNISINDISRSIGETNVLIDDAVGKAQKTDEVVRSLGEASKKITEVVSLINDLAEQTNLLALNAAIEAARAGDAGRGFAVVADEVKKLASHTSQATVDIKEQVKEILEVSDESVKALQTVVEAIHKIRDNATTVSAAVEEQSGVAKQIAGSVKDAANRVQQVDENMNGIEQAANDTGVAADQVNGSSQEVQGAFSEMKTQMQGVLDQMGIKA